MKDPTDTLETNEEMLVRILNYGCPTGALVQPFILQALAHYSERVIAAGPAACDSPLLSGAAWVKTAEFVKAELDKHFTR